MLSNADLPYSTKNPVLLPRDHHLTTLIVEKAHQIILHNGVNTSLIKILKLKRKMIIHKCTICRKFEERPNTATQPTPY